MKKMKSKIDSEKEDNSERVLDSTKLKHTGRGKECQSPSEKSIKRKSKEK